MNLLIAPGELPAFVDFTPSWRPAGYATAVFAYWLGIYQGAPGVLELCAIDPMFDQFLVCVAVGKLLLLHELQKQNGKIPDTRPFAAPIARMMVWLDRDTKA